MGKPDQAGQLFDEMQRQGLAPNLITYSATTSACEKGTRPDWAGQLLDKMQRQGLAFNVITYNATISACEKDTMPDRAELSSAQMHRQGVAPHGLVYLSMADSFVSYAAGIASPWGARTGPPKGLPV